MTSHDNYSVNRKGDANGEPESVKLLSFTPNKNGKHNTTGIWENDIHLL